MDFTPASEGFLDFFKKKSKEPSKIEKSIINDVMKPANPLVEVNTKLMEMYPEDTQKEFKKRKAFLKELLNVMSEATKKFKDVNGITFELQIKYLKAFIQEKDYKSDHSWENALYEDFAFMHELIPISIPKSKDDESYGYNTQWYLPLFDYDIRAWAKNSQYKNEFESGKRLIRDFDDTKEWYGILESVLKFFENKLKNNEFVYNITCGGDWDDGDYCIAFKPSKEIQQLAARCSSFKPF